MAGGRCGWKSSSPCSGLRFWVGGSGERSVGNGRDKMFNPDFWVTPNLLGYLGYDIGWGVAGGERLRNEREEGGVGGVGRVCRG